MESDRHSVHGFVKEPNALRCLRRIFWGSAILNGILLVVIVVAVLCQKLTIEKSQAAEVMEQTTDDTLQMPEISDVSDTESFCFSCPHLGDDVKAEDTLYDVILFTDCGKRMCCQRNHSSIVRTVASLVDVQSKRDNAGSRKTSDDLRWWRERADSAHLFLNHVSGSLTWTQRDPVGLSFNNVALVNSALQVQKKGMYFVYLALTFNFSGLRSIPQVYYNISTRFDVKGLYHRPYLLEGKYGGSPENSAHYTGFISGVFSLFKRHKIIPFVNSMEYIDKRPYTSYFGVFKL